jgi:hypothetical protein
MSVCRIEVETSREFTAVSLGVVEAAAIMLLAVWTVKPKARRS